MKVFMAGGIGREAASAERLVAEHNRLFIAAPHRNPSLVRACEVSSGQFYNAQNIYNPVILADLVEEVDPDLVWINQDDLLAAGAVDELENRLPDLAIASPNRDSARI